MQNTVYLGNMPRMGLPFQPELAYAENLILMRIYERMKTVHIAFASPTLHRILSWKHDEQKHSAFTSLSHALVSWVEWQNRWST